MFGCFVSVSPIELVPCGSKKKFGGQKQSVSQRAFFPKELSRTTAYIHTCATPPGAVPRPQLKQGGQSMRVPYPIAQSTAQSLCYSPLNAPQGAWHSFMRSLQKQYHAAETRKCMCIVNLDLVFGTASCPNALDDGQLLANEHTQDLE